MGDDNNGECVAHGKNQAFVGLDLQGILNWHVIKHIFNHNYIKRSALCRCVKKSSSTNIAMLHTRSSA